MEQRGIQVVIFTTTVLSDLLHDNVIAFREGNRDRISDKWLLLPKLVYHAALFR